MAWSSEFSDTAQTAINDTTEEFGAAIALNPGETAAGYVLVDNTSGSVTNGVRIRVYVSTDGGTNWSTQPIIEISYLPLTTGVERVPVDVTGWPHFRLGYLALAATDDYDCQYKYKLDGINIT